MGGRGGGGIHNGCAAVRCFLNSCLGGEPETNSRHDGGTIAVVFEESFNLHHQVPIFGRRGSILWPCLRQSKSRVSFLTFTRSLLSGGGAGAVKRVKQSHVSASCRQVRVRNLDFFSLFSGMASLGIRRR